MKNSKSLNYLILVNIEAKLWQMSKGQTDQPEFKLNLSIQKLDIQLENKQIQELIYLSESVQSYHN